MFQASILWKSIELGAKDGKGFQLDGFKFPQF